ncbi:MAG: hypothetical protein QI197_00935 [Candidatus Korarchaeota archaeon]|nr:hypothetical protein [Candidatus Korarchaeota archaeon]
MRSLREVIYSISVHPTIGILTILVAILLLGSWSYGPDYGWVMVSGLGILAFQLGTLTASMVSGRKLHWISLIISEALVIILLGVSFREITPLHHLIALLWVTAINLAAYIIAHSRGETPIFQLLVYASGTFFVVHSFLQYGDWEVIRELPLTPVEGAFGMFLIFISYPSLLWRLIEGGRRLLPLAFLSLTSGLMVLHGFRADVSLVILSTSLLMVRRKDPKGFALMVILLGLFVAVGEVRSYVHVPTYERVAFRLATTYYYSKELCSHFLTPLPPYGPFWLSSIPLHPSQSLGRGILSKAYGITPTMFIGLLVALGLIGMIVFSVLIGFLSGYSYRLSMGGGNDLFSYNIIWPILITRAEIGFSQLDIALIAGSVVFASLANLINGSDQAS